ncbi:MAG: hypothetical protein IJ489_00145 [Clostridia bacterium]|nr:hypothetical protein [Clostridia bacterium]
MENKKQSADAALLQEIYKNVKMGTDSVMTILGKAEDRSLLENLSADLDTYEGYAKRAREKLAEMSIVPKEVSTIQKLPAEMGITMSTLTDRSNSKIAELMIEGAVMGVTEFKDLIRNADDAGASLENIRLAGDVLAFHEEMINKMRRYL